MVILALDYGDKRTGVAVCDEGEILASPLAVIKEDYEPKVIKKLLPLIEEKKPGLIVVGKPLNMDGSFGERAEKCARFAEAVKEATGIETVTFDERLTTVEAYRLFDSAGVYGRKRKENIDAQSAVIILEDCLRKRKNSKQN